MERVLRFVEFRVDQCGKQFPNETATIRVDFHVTADGHVDTAEPKPFTGLGQCVAFAVRGNNFGQTKAGFRSSFSRAFTAQKPESPPTETP